MYKGSFNQAESRLTFFSVPPIGMQAGKAYPVEYLNSPEIGEHLTNLYRLEGRSAVELAREIGVSATRMGYLSERETTFEVLGKAYEALGSRLFLALSHPDYQHRPNIPVELFTHHEEAALKYQFSNFYRRRGGTQQIIGEDVGRVAGSVESFRRTAHSRPSSFERYFGAVGLRVGFYALANYRSNRLSLPEGLYKGIFSEESSTVVFSKNAPPSLSASQGYGAECIPITDFGSRLRARRSALGLDEVKFAREAGVDPWTVVTVEGSQTRPSFSMASKLYQAAGGGALFLAVSPESTAQSPNRTMHFAESPSALQEWFKNILTERGTTREEISKLLDVSVGSVSQFYGPGIRLPETVKKYFSALGFATVFCGIDAVQ